MVQNHKVKNSKTVERVEADIVKIDDEIIDFIDAAFVAMGGFGKLQKISFFFNITT